MGRRRFYSNTSLRTRKRTRIDRLTRLCIGADSRRAIAGPESGRLSRYCSSGINASRYCCIFALPFFFSHQIPGCIFYDTRHLVDRLLSGVAQPSANDRLISETSAKRSLLFNTTSNARWYLTYVSFGVYFEPSRTICTSAVST